MVKPYRAVGGKATQWVTSYRSGLEEKLAAQIAAAGFPVRYEDKEYRLTYTKPATPHTYMVDFVLPNGIHIESKGLFTADDRKKHLLVQAQHPHIDLRFVFQRSKTPIYKGSPTTYAGWCEKHGFKYADKLIPAAWFKE